MSASEPSHSGIFSRDEIEDMRGELSAGDVPDETPHEREARAHQIIVRSMNNAARDRESPADSLLSPEQDRFGVGDGLESEH